MAKVSERQSAENLSGEAQRAGYDNLRYYARAYAGRGRAEPTPADSAPVLVSARRDPAM